MSCPYYKVGYIGVCAASETLYVPGIDRMETYCFSDCYRLCPNFAAFLFCDETGAGASHGGAGERKRALTRKRDE